MEIKYDDDGPVNQMNCFNDILLLLLFRTIGVLLHG